MTPLRWFWFALGAGTIVGFVLLLGERRPLGGTITVGEPTITPAK